MSSITDLCTLSRESIAATKQITESEQKPGCGISLILPPANSGWAKVVPSVEWICSHQLSHCVDENQ